MEFSYGDLTSAAFLGGVLGGLIAYLLADFACWVVSFIRIVLDKK